MYKISTLIVLLPIFGALGMAQDVAEYQPLMKAVPPLVAAIRNAPDSAAAAADANKLADAYGKLVVFWKAKNAEDAVKFAETGRDAAKAIAEGGDKTANLQKIQSTCGGCHMAHREGKAPSFSIK